MLVLVTYDVSVIAEGGQRRLRNIAKVCLDHGVRVQNSVFECEVDPGQFAAFKAELEAIYNPAIRRQLPWPVGVNYVGRLIS